MPTKLLENLPRFEPETYDSTAIKLANECLRKYFYRIILGRTPFKSKYQTVFDFGSAYHKFREVLEVTFRQTSNRDESFKAALMSALVAPLTPGEGKYEYYTRERLMRSCKVAYEWWCKEKDNNQIEVIAVEQFINVQLSEGVFISGRADQIIRWNGKLWGRDFKTTSKKLQYFEATLDPNDQPVRYIHLESKLHFGDNAITDGKMVQGIIFEVLCNTADSEKGNKEGLCEIKNVTITKSLQQMEQWRKEQLFIHQILELAKKEEMYPMQPTNCSFCDFRNVCKKASESSMEYELKNNFKLAPWNPMNVEQITLDE